jgi:hypothetical protein
MRARTHCGRGPCTLGIGCALSLRIQCGRHARRNPHRATNLSIGSCGFRTRRRLGPIDCTFIENLLGLLRLQFAQSLTLHLSFFFAPSRFCSRRSFALKLEFKRLLFGEKFCRLLIPGKLLIALALSLSLSLSLLRDALSFRCSSFGRSECSGRGALITLNKRALFAHFDLNRTGTPTGVSLLDLTGLLARDRDLLFGLFLAAPMGATQSLQQRCLVGLGQTILRRLLAHTGGTQLLEQHFRRHLQFGSKFLNINTSHSVP